ncbi:myelin-associated glycoprotein-like [Salminus brasiliensis]|uniref:myelin-associated glycoprotein-like n=1 Tax=Salminus brasiliensis TaxID=930266 RepID=UPI003B82FF5D
MGTQARFLFCWLCLQVIFATVFSEDWEVEVVPKIDALVSSCVVLPCTFKYPGEQLPYSRLRGIWHKKEMHDIIYHEDKTLIVDSFKGRTKLLGDLGQKNCTLEIDKVKDHDNGPFCFRAEIPNYNKFSFVKNCVSLSMKLKPATPTLEQREVLEDGVPTTFKCFIRHTCPSHPPTITWSRGHKDAIMKNRDIGHATWEMESLLTFTPTEDDDHTYLNCTASFHGSESSTGHIRLYVKRKANILHVIIPVVAVLGTAILFGGVCFFMTKKYKQQIQELQSRDSNGMLSRLSRMSHRIRSVDWNFP